MTRTTPADHQPLVQGSGLVGFGQMDRPALARLEIEGHELEDGQAAIAQERLTLSVHHWPPRPIRRNPLDERQDANLTFVDSRRDEVAAIRGPVGLIRELL